MVWRRYRCFPLFEQWNGFYRIRKMKGLYIPGSGLQKITRPKEPSRRLFSFLRTLRDYGTYSEVPMGAHNDKSRRSGSRNLVCEGLGYFLFPLLSPFHCFLRLRREPKPSNPKPRSARVGGSGTVATSAYPDVIIIPTPSMTSFWQVSPQ